MSKRRFETVRLLMHPNSDGSLTIHWSRLSYRGWQEPQMEEGSTIRSSDAIEQLDALTAALAAARAAASHKA